MTRLYNCRSSSLVSETRTGTDQHPATTVSSSTITSTIAASWWCSLSWWWWWCRTGILFVVVWAVLGTPVSASRWSDHCGGAAAATATIAVGVPPPRRSAGAVRFALAPFKTTTSIQGVPTSFIVGGAASGGRRSSSSSRPSASCRWCRSMRFISPPSAEMTKTALTMSATFSSSSLPTSSEEATTTKTLLEEEEDEQQNDDIAPRNNNAPDSCRSIIDQSGLILLEHVNLNLPDYRYAMSFYGDLLRCGMDPRKVQNVRPSSHKRTVWFNCGASQFHLPYDVTAQCIPGQIGLRYDSLDGIQQRVQEQLSKPEEERIFQHAEVDVDAQGQPYVRIVDRYGNVFQCRTSRFRDQRLANDAWTQPILIQGQYSRNDAINDDDEEAPIVDVYERFGLPNAESKTECRGLDYVEFLCPMGTAEQIAEFYETVLDATTAVLNATTTRQDDSDTTDMAAAATATTKVAMIAFGNIDSAGRADQALLFRESAAPIPPYDGHHIALYAGRSAIDFAQAFENCCHAGIVWVNPRFDDKAITLDGAKEWQQFRFKNIINVQTGKTIFTLEHEIRCVCHSAFPGPQDRML